MAVPRSFKYTPLTGERSFRLLDLSPGELDGPIRCHIYEEDLNLHRSYEAISYVWGNSKRPIDLICNGNKVLNITRNLAATLRSIRHATEIRTVWADSVCIDQENHDERTHQVRQMGSIYAEAFRVLIWLGAGISEPDLHTLRTGLDSLSALRPQEYQLRDRVSQTFNSDTHLDDGDRHYEDIRLEFGLPPINSDEFVAVREFFQRDWFYRAWTYQESRLAKERNFFLGNVPLAEQTLIDTAYALALLFIHFKTTTFQHQESAQGMLHRGGAAQVDAPNAIEVNQLGTLLVRRRGAGCKEKKDNIYSLLGVNRNFSTIIPQYKKKTDEQVFIDTAFDIIQQERNLDVFQGVLKDCHQSGELALPSWVPDWSTKTTTFKRTFQEQQTRHFFSTGPSLPFCKLVNHAQLDILGREIDTIKSLAPADMPSDPLESWLQHEIGSAQDQHGIWTYRDGESLSFAMLRIRCTDLKLLDSDDPYGRWNNATTNRARRWYEAVDGPFNNPDHPDFPIYVRFFITLQAHMVDRKVMVTQRKRVGIAPSNAQEGDVVALLFGGKVPILLRAEGNKYRFIGECFLDGVMYGEEYERVEGERGCDFGEDWRETFSNGTAVEGALKVFTLI